MRPKSKIFFLMGVVGSLLLVSLPMSTNTLAISKRLIPIRDVPGDNVSVTLDQHYYYDWEEVSVIVRLTENGTGYQGFICSTIIDPLGEEFGGMCMVCDEQGYCNFSFSTDGFPGVYTLITDAHFTLTEIEVTKHFEVVQWFLETEAGGPYEGYVNHPVKFYGSVTGGKPPYTWYWDFGDGCYSTEQNPVHTYTTKNNYTVLLTVTDSQFYYDSDTTTANIVWLGSPQEISVIT